MTLTRLNLKYIFFSRKCSGFLPHAKKRETRFKHYRIFGEVATSPPPPLVFSVVVVCSKFKIEGLTHRLLR